MKSPFCKGGQGGFHIEEVVIPNLLLMDWYDALVTEFENTVPARPMRGAHV